VILDLSRFVETERPHWTALEKTLDWMERNPGIEISIQDLDRFHVLYQRASADLARVATLASEGELRLYLEGLVGRAYAEVHESRERKKFRPWRWFTTDFPRAVRRHSRALLLAVALTLVGSGFGALAMRLDPEAKTVIVPFQGLEMTPAERVAREQRLKGSQLSGKKGRFSAELMTHNTQVALLTIALGMTFGFGTIVMLFYNGVILGAVAFDYVHGGQSVFLLGWLLPHGVIEIPAILLGGQTGFVLAHALIGWGSRLTRSERLRSVSRDVVTLSGGIAVMLVWAGIVEAFLSQYHEPVISYGMKIGFGLVEAALLVLFLTRAGANSARANLE
jgi:uncharacterized membrane protein SpoIIM required for sporulation